MRALAVVIGFVLAVAAVAVVLAFPDRFGDYLPDFLQPSVQGGPQLVLQVEPESGDAAQAVADSMTVIERRLKDLAVRFVARPEGSIRILLGLSKSADANHVIEVATR